MQTRITGIYNQFMQQPIGDRLMQTFMASAVLFAVGLTFNHHILKTPEERAIGNSQANPIPNFIID